MKEKGKTRSEKVRSSLILSFSFCLLFSPLFTFAVRADLVAEIVETESMYESVPPSGPAAAFVRIVIPSVNG